MIWPFRSYSIKTMYSASWQEEAITLPVVKTTTASFRIICFFQAPSDETNICPGVQRVQLIQIVLYQSMSDGFLTITQNIWQPWTWDVRIQISLCRLISAVCYSFLIYGQFPSYDGQVYFTRADGNGSSCMSQPWIMLKTILSSTKSSFWHLHNW